MQALARTMTKVHLDSIFRYKLTLMMYQGKRILRLLNFSHDAKASETFSFSSIKSWMKRSRSRSFVGRKMRACAVGELRQKLLEKQCWLGSDLGYENHLADTCWMFIHESHAFCSWSISCEEIFQLNFSISYLWTTLAPFEELSWSWRRKIPEIA